MAKKITKIKAQKRRGRFNVYLNGRYAFPISEAVLIRYRIFKGGLVTPELEKRLRTADQISKLYNVAVNFLAHHLRTKAEIIRKLSKKTASPVSIHQVLEKLERLNLVDDQNYANCYVRTMVRAKKRGPIVIKRNLRRKRVPVDKIALAIQTFYPLAKQLQIGSYQAKKLSRRYRRDSFRKGLQKIKGNLIRRGFSFSVANQAIRACHFRPDLASQQHLLLKRARLAWRRYRNENSFERRMKTKRYLYRQGFSFDEINQILARFGG